MANSITEEKLPHVAVYKINPEASYITYQDEIEKRLRQAEAITFMGASVTDETYVFQQGTAVHTFQFLYDLITEIRFFHDKETELLMEEFRELKTKNEAAQ